MRVNKTSTGVALALAAASLFAIIPASAGTTGHDSQVHSMADSSSIPTTSP